jgi:hypothetical protein
MKTEITGASAYASAAVTGTGPPAPTGTVTYRFFANGACAAPPASSQTVAVGTSSPPTSPLATGSYSFQAAYSGDANYSGATSPCEPFTVTQGAATAATTLHDAADSSVIPAGNSVPLDTSVFDTATVTGVAGITPTGMVTYTFFTNGTCTAPAVSSDTVALNTQSSPTGPLSAGSYSFQAAYSGDLNYTGSTAACEKFTVTHAPASQITRGEPTCQEFTSGTSTSLTAGRYSVKGTIINGVDPGVFSYFTQVVAPAADFTASILQTNNSGTAPPYQNVPIDNRRVTVYNSACQTVPSGLTEPSRGNADVTISGATTGDTYIVSVKYSLTSLKGDPVPPKDPLTYTFSTKMNGTPVTRSRQNLLFETKAT